MLSNTADPSKPWPPPDPDRVYRAPRAAPSGDGFTQSMDVNEFRKRQEADLQRHQSGVEHVVRRRPFHERYAHLAQSENADDYYNNGENDDAIATDSEADEEIQSPETLNHQSAAEEGEEA
jgi:palmitoyltransferase